MNPRLTSILCLLVFLGPSHSKRRAKVACIGDTITLGNVGTTNARVSYPGKLEEYLSHHKNYTVSNFGSKGVTVTKHTDRPYWSTPEFEEAKKFGPSIVVMEFGMNDAKSRNWNESAFIEDYKSMITTFQNLESHPHVFVCIPPPFYSNVSKFDVQPHIVNTVLPRVVAKIANDMAVSTIDLFNTLGGSLARLTMPWLYTKDGTFPTDAGHVYIARHVAASILGIELHQHNTHKHKVKGTNTTKVTDGVKPSDKTKFLRF